MCVQLEVSIIWPHPYSMSCESLTCIIFSDQVSKPSKELLPEVMEGGTRASMSLILNWNNGTSFGFKLFSHQTIKKSIVLVSGLSDTSIGT